MSQEIFNILMSALGVIVTSLAGFIATKLTQFISNKIENEKIANNLILLTKIVTDCVQEIYQTFVDSLKKEGKFDKEAQKVAFDTCLAKITSKLTPELVTFITKNFGNSLNEYLTSLIESKIYELKSKDGE